MDYKAAWDELRNGVDGVIEVYQEFEDRGKLTERGNILRESYRNVAEYMKLSEEIANINPPQDKRFIAVLLGQGDTTNWE